MSGDLGILLASLAFGIGSAILPIVLNAEAYVVLQAALLDRRMLLASILALSIGTSIGKAVVFELVRRGSERAKKTSERREPRTRAGQWIRRIGDQMLGWLDRPVIGPLTVFASALLSVPPLAVVTVVAAMSRQSHWVFQVMVFLGRVIQFLAIGFILHQVF